MKAKSEKQIKRIDISEYRSTIINQIQLKKYDDAISSKSAIKHYPDTIPLYKTLFTLYTFKKEYDKGIQVLIDGINKNRNELSMYLMLSDVYFSTKKYSDSIDLLNSIQERFPKNSKINRRLSNGYLFRNDFKSAINEINKAITKEKSILNLSHKIALYFQKYFFFFIPLFVLLMLAALITGGIFSIALFSGVLLFIISLIIYYYSNRFFIHGVGMTVILVIILILECVHFVV